LANMQALTAKYEMGVSIDQVQLKNINPPRPDNKKRRALSTQLAVSTTRIFPWPKVRRINAFVPLMVIV